MPIMLRVMVSVPAASIITVADNEVVLPVAAMVPDLVLPGISVPELYARFACCGSVCAYYRIGDSVGSGFGKREISAAGSMGYGCAFFKLVGVKG